MKKRILVIDDEKEFLKMTKLNLERENKYQVAVLSTAKELMPYMHRFNPDVILLDLVMPGVGGLEACEMLNKDPVGRRIPIIVLSALDKDTDKIKAYKLGVVDYLIKPIYPDDLIAKIEKALEDK